MEKSLLIVRQFFKKYYEKFGDTIYIKDPSEREFMFMTFDGKVRRHFTFRDVKSLREGLRREVPMHAYYSISKYLDPTAPMDEKKAKKADVLFDIDATELEGCGRWDLWYCNHCGTYGTGEKPEKCPKCGSEELKSLRWLDHDCIEAAKNELKKLLKLLKEDFGLKEGITISYTGNRGFHVRITSEEYTKLSKEARRELALYVIGAGADPDLWLKRVGSLYLLDPPQGQARRSIKILLEGNLSGTLKRKVEGMLQGKPTRLNRRELSLLYTAIKNAVSEVSPKIDWIVTMDTSRFTRVPNSLHGKTGFRSIILTPSEIDDFNPFRSSSIPLKWEVQVRLKLPVPRFEVGGDAFGPYEVGDKISLPINAASF